MCVWGFDRFLKGCLWDACWVCGGGGTYTAFSPGLGTLFAWGP